MYFLGSTRGVDSPRRRASILLFSLTISERRSILSSILISVTFLVEGGELNPILEPCYPLRGYPIAIWIRGRASTVNSFLAAPPTRGRACFNNELQVTYKSTLTGFCGSRSNRNSVCDLQAFIQGNPSHKHILPVSQAKQERCASLLHWPHVAPLSPP